MKYNHITYFNYLLGFILLAFSIIFNGCTKEVNPDLIENNTFLHVYPESGDQNCIYIKATYDNCFLVLINGKVDENTLSMMKLNEHGDVLWKKDIANVKLPTITCNVEADGSIILSPESTTGNFVKLDKDGNVVFITEVWNVSQMGGPNVLNGYGVKANNGTYHFSFSGGSSDYRRNNTWICCMTPTGAIYDYKHIYDSLVRPDFKLLYLGLHKCVFDAGGNRTYYMNGWCFPRMNWQWSDLRKIFIARQTFTSTDSLIDTKVVLVDSLIGANGSNSLYQQYTSDNKLLLISTELDIDNINKGRLIKVNDSLEIEWQKDIRLTPYGTNLKCIYECPDGNYLLTGACSISGKTESQPCVVRVDRNGNIIWYKIFNTNLSGFLHWGIQLQNGGLMLGGSTTGFGFGNTLNDVLLIKTDRDGNYK